MNLISDRGYANPDMLVSSEWVGENIQNPNIRLIESNEDQLLYASGHIQGAVEIDWVKDLNDSLRRDYLDKDAFNELLKKNGISDNTTLVFYGDKNNWWACYALWVFELFGLKNLKILDGGRLKWINEGRALTKEVPKYPVSSFSVSKRDDETNRAFRDDVLLHINKGGALVDVRSPEEFSGERLHMADYPNEGALRGGHIPGARNIPWAKSINLSDGTFKTATELRDIYSDEIKISSSGDEVITYCRIGERSSHTWFVLKYLLGLKKVRNYDGSWTEWGNLVNVPIEK